MTDFSVRGVHVTVGLTAFMWVARNEEFAACPTVSISLTNGLLISDSPFMVGEIRLVPEMSVAVRAGIRTHVATHGELVRQMLHIWSHVFATPCRTLYTHILWPWLLSGSLSCDNAG